MKKILALMFLFIFFASNLIAAPIPVKVISSSFHVAGAYQGYYWLDLTQGMTGSQNDGYDKSGTTPQIGALSYSSIYPDPSWPEEHALANSSAGLFNISASADAAGFTTYTASQANASGEVIFRPLINFNTLNYSYDFNITSSLYTQLGASLFDLTANIEIFTLDYESLSNWFVLSATGTINHTFQSDHLYRMNLGSGSTAMCDKGYARFEFPDLNAVPEPTTMLLLGLGLVGLAGVRRKVQ